MLGQFSNGISKRTPGMIGRQKYLELLRKKLHLRGENHFVCFWALGGLGKTRLLEELQHLVDEANKENPGYVTCGIIDLYHSDTHSSSDVERAIVDGFDPGRKSFVNYRRQRYDYEMLRERGADPNVLEHHREQLSEAFVKDCRELGTEARKLVICFDTIELLQYESSIVEDKVGSQTADTRVRFWLLDKLPQLHNVLIVFAGRPKTRSATETIDHQHRLVEDMKRAFDAAFADFELPPLTLKETEALIAELSPVKERRQVTDVASPSKHLEGEDAQPPFVERAEVVPGHLLPIVHRLSGGRPIFVHLIFDLLQTLSPEYTVVKDQLSAYESLQDLPEDDPQLKAARKDIQALILNAIFNESGEMGEYLKRIALMPKGVDTQILCEVLGLPKYEAEKLIDEFAPLSFVKRFSPPPGAQRLHGDRIFLHDEMYHLLSSEIISSEIIGHKRVQERQLAQGVITSYYDPQIARVNALMSASKSPEDRIPLRERLQKLQVERLYYLLVRDPRQGYAEYKLLSDQSNRRRWVGYGMRLLDEFLRFYNSSERREQIAKAGILHEHVIRDSTLMWVERFYWWGQTKRCVELANRVLRNPSEFTLRSEDVATLGNVCALWADASAVLYGYSPKVVEEAQSLLNRLPEQGTTPEEILAYARLRTSIGYQLRRGGLLARAAGHYILANSAFRRLKGYEDELAMLLNNLSYAYAKQGRLALASPLAHEALRINEESENEYSTGLTLSTLAAIEVLRGNYAEANEYAKEALDLFRVMGDAHGTVLANSSIARANRKMAKRIIEKGRKLDEARRKLEDARDVLTQALAEARIAELKADQGMIHAEMGRVYRELGRTFSLLKAPQEAEDHYQRSDDELTQALAYVGDSRIDRADILQDVAELRLDSNAYETAEESLKQVEEVIGNDYLIEIDDSGKPLPPKDSPSEYFWPLGKAERLRADIAFRQSRHEEGLRHYVIAYAYFARFSADSVEKNEMLELVYDRLGTLAIDKQRELVEATRRWSKDRDFGVAVQVFTDTLRDLKGV